MDVLYYLARGRRLCPSLPRCIHNYYGNTLYIPDVEILCKLSKKMVKFSRRNK